MDRVTAFTDAAVAIALTLLALPLVDVAREDAGMSLAALWRYHSGDVFAFLLSFFVVATAWRVHRRIFNQLHRLDEPLLFLNLLWLLGVVFLPVPTAVLTFETGAENGPSVLYLANLLYVSLASLALGVWTSTHPALVRPGSLPHEGLWRGVGAAGTLAVATGLAVAVGSWALLLLAAMPLMRGLAHRLQHGRWRFG